MFVVAYDWACGQVLSVDEIESNEEAEAKREELAFVYQDDASIEVVVREERPSNSRSSASM